MSPKISVIVPIYNVEAYLRGCVDSICAQTYRNLEIILIDDGSTDGCAALCDRYALADPRIRAIHKENGGLASAKNAGLDAATGDYIGFVDGDDSIEPDMYETMLESLMRNDCEIAVCGRYLQQESGEMTPSFTLEAERVMYAQEAVRRLLLSDGLDAASWDKLYRREVFDGVRFPSRYVSEDVPVTSHLLSQAKRVVHCGRPLYRYLQRAGSLSRSSFSEKSMGMYYFYKDVGLRMGKIFPELEEEGRSYYYKELLILLLRYAASQNRSSLVKEPYAQARREILGILRNRYLAPKYKLFALAVFAGAYRPVVQMGVRLGTRGKSSVRVS